MAADSFESLCHKAREALAEANGQLARQLYLQALGLQPDSPDAHYGLATACFLLGDLEGAAYHFKEVIRTDPLRAGAYINLGAVYNRMGNLDEAVKALRKGIQLDSKRAEAYYNLGLAYRRLGQVELAIQAYREATHLNPRMADAHFNLGNLLFELGRIQQAVTHYRSALEVRPTFEKARQALQQAEDALGEAETPAARKKESTPTIDASQTDLGRTLDPVADGPALTALHRATVDSQNHNKEFLEILEREVEPAIKELSTCLLYPEKTSAELRDRLQRFEAAMNNLRQMQQEIQQTMKRIHELSERLILSPQSATTP